MNMANLFFIWLDKPGSLTSMMLVIIFSFIFAVFLNAQFRGRLSWLDLVCRNNTNIISLSKVLQLVGGIVSTWIVVKSTLLSNGNISWEIFTAYLAYVGSVEAYGKYITLKHSQSSSYDNYQNPREVDSMRPVSPTGLNPARKKRPTMPQFQQNVNTSVREQPQEDDEDEDKLKEQERIGGAKAIE